MGTGHLACMLRDESRSPFTKNRTGGGNVHSEVHIECECGTCRVRTPGATLGLLATPPSGKMGLITPLRSTTTCLMIDPPSVRFLVMWTMLVDFGGSDGRIFWHH